MHVARGIAARARTSQTMNDLGYLRQPAIRGDTIVFVSDDDLWQVAAAGGIARRLTAGLGEPTTPALSPDGRWLAYVGRDEQHPEVYVMPADGGPARRMTWLGANFLNVAGFAPDGRIVFVTTHGQPFFRYFRAYALAPAGGLPELLPLGQVNHLSFGPGQAKVIGRNTADPARWKRYRGGTASHLWIDATGSGQFRRMTELKGNITSPMWVGDRVYFLSDFEGVGNLYSCRPDGADLEAAHRSRRLLRALRVDRWPEHRLPVRRPDLAVRPRCRRNAGSWTSGCRASHAGGAPLRDGGRSSGELPGAPGRPQPGGRGTRQALLVRAVGGCGAAARKRRGRTIAPGSMAGRRQDARGGQRRDRRRARRGVRRGGERTLDWDIGRVHCVARRSGGHARIALTNHRNEVWIGDVATGETWLADRSDAGRSDDVAWSPDGLWLAYSFWVGLRHCAIKLYDTAARTSVLVTRPEFSGNLTVC